MIPNSLVAVLSLLSLSLLFAIGLKSRFYEKNGYRYIGENINYDTADNDVHQGNYQRYGVLPFPKNT